MLDQESELDSRHQRLTLRPTSRGKIVGKSAKIRAVIDTIDRIAKSNCNVLITGESGTGKESTVAAIHDASKRADKPLVTVNCGALPEALMESELFGHARGAFTGAHATRQGRVAQAEGGTLFLDEIGELPMALQAKLLRLLQQREYTPVGDNRTIKCDIRIIAATNRKLADEVARGTFREDLFYRLNVIELQIPALRERREDIEVLVEHFYRESLAMSGRDDLEGFDDDAIEAMLDHDWPGNIRELENVIQRAVLLAPGPVIQREDIPANLQSSRGPASSAVPAQLPDEGINLREVIEEFESSLVRQALERTKWNKNQAAKLLGMNRTTLVEMVKRKRIG
ncbi:MAG: sigma-54-dependent Fis family transcriptional regulator [Deltaproteobacteria bacterium]|nr:sigma-54-dependent Fis family transcriptional regulator [Deltaproteobacteria bacterium]